MAYCKFCGIESEDPNVCQWCGRPLPPVPTAPAVPPPPSMATETSIEKTEKAIQASLRGFILSALALVVVAGILIAIRSSLYPAVSLTAMFLLGILLGCWRVIPSFDSEWAEIGIPLILLLLLPAWLVFAGYLIYGLINRDMDATVVWILGSYFAALVTLEMVAWFSLPDRVPMEMLLKFRAVEFLGWPVVLFGWIVSGSFRPID